jgi:hypothetical protein
LEQFRTLQDLRDYVSNLGKIYARPAISGEHPTLYLDHSQGPMVYGIREKDYLLSSCRQWVIPHDQMGLSFSAHWQHLKDKIKLKKKFADGRELSVHWVLEGADIPEGLKFVPDKNDRQHYFLTVTEKMTVNKLAEKLSWVADRMSKIEKVGRLV